MDETIEFQVPEDAAGSRIDTYLASETSLASGPHRLSRSRIQLLISEGNVEVDGGAISKSLKLKGGEMIRVRLPEPETEADVPPENIPLDIRFEDEHIIVVNKPAGMISHATSDCRTGTLINALKGKGVNLPGMYQPYRPGIVHRLDKLTSGLMVVAKTEDTYLTLVDRMKERLIKREYLALTIGNLPRLEGRFDGDIGRHQRDRKKMAVVAKGGKHAVTQYQVLQRFPGIDFCGVMLETGRTHQIRVHFSNAGMPVLGDSVYGGGKSLLSAMKVRMERMGLTPGDRKTWLKTGESLNEIASSAPGHMLHAFRLSFAHPVKDEPLSFEAEKPDYFLKCSELLKHGGGSIGGS